MKAIVMKNDRKIATVYCNPDFIEICTMSRCSVTHKDPLGDDFFFSFDTRLEVLGNALTSAFQKSRDLSSTSEEIEKFNKLDEMNKNSKEWFLISRHKEWLKHNPDRLLFEESLEKKRYTEWICFILKRYAYKNEKTLFKNMQLCSVTKEKSEITFLPFGRREARKGDFRFTICSPSSPEIIGAAVKYSIARCTGKGADLVANKLLPDGVPDTFDDYLKSLSL
jgi:hypothetical protein